MKKLFLCAMLVVLTMMVKGQSCDLRLNGNYLKSYLGCGLEIVKQPLHYGWSDWCVVAAVGGAAALTFVYDEEIFHEVNNDWLNGKGQEFANYSDAFGNGLVTLPLLTTLYVVGSFQEDCRWREASLGGLQAYLLPLGAGFVVKELTCRVRPNDSEDAGLWEGPFATFSSTSFPSGHTCRAFAVATVMAASFRDAPWVGAVAYSCAAVTAVGRLTSREHWPSDVLMGAAMGYFIGRGVAKFYDKMQNDNQMSLVPCVNDTGLGVALRF